MEEIRFPEYVRDILSALSDAGHEAFAVGGCIRDSLLGREVKDWDITTSALPEQVLADLSERGFDVHAGTGLKHGTVTVVQKSSGEAFACEVTTYRRDGSYLDSRHPDSVEFVTSLREDLARRDFTVNAMASDSISVIDPFGGREDLQNGIIRCVGEPMKRFSEDALRILRGLRFTARYGFVIEEETERAMTELCETIKSISVERIAAELSEIFGSDLGCDVLLRYRSIIGGALGIYISEENARLASESDDEFVRFALYFGDELCRVCKHLKLSSRLQRRGRDAIEARAERCPVSRSEVKRFMNRYPEDHRIFLQYCGIIKGERDAYDRASEIAADIIRLGEAYTLSGLSVSGEDLLRAGFMGKEIGQALDRLLLLVMDGVIPNQRGALIDAARKKEGYDVLL